MSRPRAFTWYGWEHMSRMSQGTQQSLELTSVHTASKASKHKCSPGFPKLSCQFLLSSNQPGQGSSPLCRSRTECPIHGSGCSSPRVGTSLFFLSYTIIYVFFLQPCVFRSPSASFQIVFSEHYTTFRCIFDAFLGTGELQVGVLLLHHLS